jgi:hypothetical protein
MKKEYIYTLFVVALLIATLSTANAASVIVSEDFEDGILDPLISIHTTGAFSSNPGIKAFSNIDGANAFGYGMSTCGFSCFNNYATDLVIEFSQPTSIASLSFSEMEVNGNWGSIGAVLVDGVEIGGFGRMPNNDGGADSTFRNHIFDINDTVSKIELRVWDITSSSEIYIDNIMVTSVPVPGAIWLLGSGLLGLVGKARQANAAGRPFFATRRSGWI